MRGLIWAWQVMWFIWLDNLPANKLIHSHTGLSKPYSWLVSSDWLYVCKHMWSIPVLLIVLYRNCSLAWSKRYELFLANSNLAQHTCLQLIRRHIPLMGLGQATYLPDRKTQSKLD